MNPAATNIDGSYTVRGVRFTTGATVSVQPLGGSTLTTTAATGTYTFSAGYALGAFNVFSLAAGETVFNGAISGNYGFEKDGAGTLTLNGGNIFAGSVTVQGGTLRINGTNVCARATTVGQITFVLGGNVLDGAAGTLGNATSSVTVGADSATTTFPGQTPSATLAINGNYIVDRGNRLRQRHVRETLRRHEHHGRGGGGRRSPGQSTLAGRQTCILWRQE